MKFPTPAQTPATQPNLLVLLQGEPWAIKMVAAWANIGSTKGDHEDVFKRWRELSGAPSHEASRLCLMLVHNGIVGPDGYVDPNAMKVVNSAASSFITSAAPKPVRRGRMGG